MDSEMTSEENRIQFILKILRESFPDRSDKQLVPIGMIYSGARWGRDYRFCEVPKIEGVPLLACNSQQQTEKYFSWLADYLYQLNAEPDSDQGELCMLLNEMIAQDACLALGMHAALYLLETESMEIHIEKGHSFEQYLSKEKEKMSAQELAELDENRQRALYEQVAAELMEWLELAPTVSHIDIPWRIPLSTVLKKAENKEKRIDLLQIFYSTFFQYAEKLKQ